MSRMPANRTAPRSTSAGRVDARDRKQIHDEPYVDSLQHLADSLKAQWKRYRKRLKRCQEKFSEEAVHDSRVETRRLLSTVELLGAFLPEHRIKKARRALKRHLDAFDDLRDTHVQLLYVGKMLRGFPAARPVHGYLLRCAERDTVETRKRIKRIRTKRLGRVIAGCRAELGQMHKRRSSKQALTLLRRAVQRAFDRVLRMRQRIEAERTATIHRTRVAFKKYRYMVESLADILPGMTGKLFASMHHYQSMMGDIQDMEVLLGTLDKLRTMKEIESEHSRVFRDELVRRRRWLLERYLNAADKLLEFRPLPEPAGNSAASRKRERIG